jgi:hypothetical protein
VTIAQQHAGPGSAGQMPVLEPSALSPAFPSGTVVSTLYTSSRRTHKNPNDEHPPKVISHDLVLMVLGERVAGLPPPKYIEMYVVRADGSVVRHQPVSDTNPLLLHRPESVFKVLQPGNAIRLRVFENVRAVPCKWPKHHRKIPRTPGLVLVILRGEEGERRAHVVFLCPPKLDHIWATDAEKNASLR